MAHRKHPRLQVREGAARRFERAELRQRLRSFQRIREVLAAVVDARRAGPHQQIVAEDLGPEILDLLRFGEEAMPPDIEVEALVGLRPRDAADVPWIALEDSDGDEALAEQVRRSQAGGPGADDRDVIADAHGAPPSATVASRSVSVSRSESKTKPGRPG